MVAGGERKAVASPPHSLSQRGLFLSPWALRRENNLHQRMFCCGVFVIIGVFVLQEKQLGLGGFLCWWRAVRGRRVGPFEEI